MISGGDPLFLDNNQLEKILFDLSRIATVKTIRLNTRALTFNPYRLTEDTIKLFKKYNLNSLEIHMAHPREISPVVDKTLGLFDELGYRPNILWRSPILKGINDSYEVLEELFLALFERRIIPYYIFHFAPYCLGRAIYGTSIKKGIEILSKLRRRVPGPAFPRYTLFHETGKKDIPLEINGTPDFQFTENELGKKIVRFKNWRDDWVIYPDIVD